MEFKVCIPDVHADAMDADGESAEEAVREVFGYYSTEAHHGEALDAFVLTPSGDVMPVRITVDVRVEPRVVTADEIEAAYEMFEVERPAQVTDALSGGLRTLG